VSKSSLP